MNIFLCPCTLCLIVYTWIHGWLEQFKNVRDIAKLTSRYGANSQPDCQYTKVPVCPYLHQPWGLSSFLIVDHLLCEKWVLLLHCHFFNYNEVEHFLHIYRHSIYFSGTWLFVSFAHLSNGFFPTFCLWFMRGLCNWKKKKKAVLCIHIVNVFPRCPGSSAG